MPCVRVGTISIRREFEGRRILKVDVPQTFLAREPYPEIDRPHPSIPRQRAAW
jgi:hypothetical protein